MPLPELLLIFTASLLGSFHCGAMCSGFAVSVMRPGRWGTSAARSVAYHAGKLFTYVFVGAAAGVAGAAVLNHPGLRVVQMAFSALAGAIIVVVGLQTLGLLSGQSVVNRLATRLWLGPFFGPIVRTFRERETLDAAFFLGVFNGFLPCGLVYAFAVAAAGTGSFAGAVLTMLAFGLGTVPVLVAAAVGGTVLAGWSRLRPTLARASGVLVIALGALTVLRATPLTSLLAAGHAPTENAGHAGHPADVAPVSADVGTSLEPAPAPHFTLTDQDGRRVSLHDFHGRVVVMDFIYTSCTTTCPLLTATFRSLQDGLGDELGSDIVLVSITVDPETDTPAVLKSFGEGWGADFGGWTFLTGGPQEIASTAEAYAVYVGREGQGLAHTETILLIDRRGQLRHAFGLRADPRAILAAARRLALESHWGH